MYTETFYRTAKAYNDGYRYIGSKGGTRSGKTFGELQLLDLILSKPKPRIVTTVSQSLPHLIGGAIRDYDKILMDRGIYPDLIRTKNPYIYRYGQSIHEFVGFDSPGKALGASRDILFINECNKLEWPVVHQLMQRTSEVVFFDWNPSSRFWVDDPELFDIANKTDATVVHSTFRDNYDNLTDKQIEDFRQAKTKADGEAERGVYGYWSNWWRVYGEGEYGQIEGAIYTDWEIGDFDYTLPYRYGLDFGFSSDPDALVKIAIDEKKKIVYLHECFYKNGQSFDVLTSQLEHYVGRNERIVADCAEDRLISDLQRRFNIVRCTKWKVIERIKKLQGYHLVVTKESVNLQSELMEYVWSDKKSETPIDKNNHALDAVGYAFTNGMAQQTSVLL
jgi:phage terminase large subunit